MAIQGKREESFHLKVPQALQLQNAINSTEAAQTPQQAVSEGKRNQKSEPKVQNEESQEIIPREQARSLTKELMMVFLSGF